MEPEKKQPLLHRITVVGMEVLEKGGYFSTGFSFLLLGMFIFWYAWSSFFLSYQNNLPSAALVLMGHLLLVVVLLELFLTILNFIKTHHIELDPFLHIGIVAAVRRILSLEAKEINPQIVTEQHFYMYLAEVGTQGGLILIMVVALFLNRKRSS